MLVKKFFDDLFAFEVFDGALSVGAQQITDKRNYINKIDELNHAALVFYRCAADIFLEHFLFSAEAGRWEIERGKSMGDRKRKKKKKKKNQKKKFVESIDGNRKRAAFFPPFFLCFHSISISF